MSNVAITLPDGSVKQFDGPVTGAELASAIGPGLAKAALAIKIDGKVLDISHSIETDSIVEIITRKSDDVLDLIRHDTAHVMAEAVQELFPGTQVTIGPSIENGRSRSRVRSLPECREIIPELLLPLHGQCRGGSNRARRRICA